MKAKDTLFLNNTVTQNPISARRALFWHVASNIMVIYMDFCTYVCKSVFKEVKKKEVKQSARNLFTNELK